MNKLKTYLSVFLFCFSLSAENAVFHCQNALAEDAISPKLILEKSDRARGGIAQGLQWQVAIESHEGESTQKIVFLTKVKGGNVLTICKEPARQRDEAYLFNEHSLWVYRPGLRKPISVSPRQRLSGQIANGDIATTNYSKDYDAKLLRKEKIGKVLTYKLELKAKAGNTTYDKILYWVTEDQFLAIRAEFLTLEGKPFKTATFKYENTLLVNQKPEPFISEMTVTDSAFEKNYSLLKYEKPSIVALSDSLFNINNLAR